jgi:hypothetical protein
LGDLEEKNGGIVRQSRIDGSTCTLADKEGIVAEVLLVFFLRVGGDTQRSYVDHFRVDKSLGLRVDITDQALDKILRLGTGGAYENGVTSVNMAENFINTVKFFRARITPMVQWHVEISFSETLLVHMSDPSSGIHEGTEECNFPYLHYLTHFLKSVNC